MIAARFARFLYTVPALCYTGAPLCAWGASEASGYHCRYEYVSVAQRICLPVERQLNKCTPIQPNGATLCHTVCIQIRQTHMTPKIKLNDVTFVLGDKPMSNLLWCNKVPKGKRNKPAKINGVLVNEPGVFHEL